MKINLQLTGKEMKLHHEARAFAFKYRQAELGLCRVLREIDRTRLHVKLGHSGIFSYAVKELGLTESVAYTAITVARKSAQMPELKKAVDEGQLSVSKASRIASGLTAENAAELVAFAQTHTTKEIDQEMARRFPEKTKRDHRRPVGEGRTELRGEISSAVLEKLKRVEILLASKGKPTNLDGVLAATLEHFLEHHDPLRKAKRAQARRVRRAKLTQAGTSVEPAAHNAAEAAADNQAEIAAHNPAEHAATQPETRFCLNRVDGTSAGEKRPTAQVMSLKKAPLKAHVHDAAILYAGARCTFRNERGERCTEERWLEVHHIIPKSLGGNDELTNLTCLCSAHHALVHQLSLPLEGQVTWIRSPQLAYQA